MDAAKTTSIVNSAWDETIIPTLHDYIRIPNKSPVFDADWVKNGHMEKAVELIASWCSEQPIEGMTLEVVRLKDEDGNPRTPLIYMDIPGDNDDCVVLYGHLDKQPEMVGWAEDLHPWKPVLKGDKLYGRGGADDGYAAFASLTAIRALREQGGKHARCVVLIEGCEESGSYDLPYYIDHLQDRIGSPSLVICLDSGCGNYDQLWCTTSLRGLVSGDLRIDVLEEGVHSGDASGIVASSFRVLRTLLSRLDDTSTGEVLPDFLRVEIPQQRIDQAGVAARVLGDDVVGKFPWAGGMQPMTADMQEAVLNRTWRPALSVTGIEGLPDLGNAGNVLRPFTSVKVSMRIPPMVDADVATAAMKELLEKDPPYGAKVTFDPEQGAAGWNAPPLVPWLDRAVDAASRTFFGKEAVWMGEGGTIPFMGMLGEKFPEAQFMITGVLGPQSNAHGPNEFLHLPTGKRLTACVTQVLEEHFKTANS